MAREAPHTLGESHAEVWLDTIEIPTAVVKCLAASGLWRAHGKRITSCHSVEPRVLCVLVVSIATDDGENHEGTGVHPPGLIQLSDARGVPRVQPCSV